MIRFGPWNRWHHPASQVTAAETLTTALNLDRSKDGQTSVRDGLSRPSNWPGILFTQSGLESTTTAKAGTFGQAVRSLIPVDRVGGQLPVLTFGES